MKTSKSAILSVTQLILAAWISVAPGTRAQSPGSGGKLLLNLDRDGRAIQGYDPVAYFTDNQPVKGDPRFSARHEGAVYQFATAEHQKLFEANPAKYAPAFGGYCGYAASINRLSPISPEWFQVLEGRLVLQHNKKALDRWRSGCARKSAQGRRQLAGVSREERRARRARLGLCRQTRGRPRGL